MIDTILGGRYRIVRLLGKGGMGSVYEAIAEANGERVAVKVVTADISGDESLVGRFELEARAAAAIETPHIARVLDAGWDTGCGLPYLVMEFLDGEDLQQLLKRVGPLASDVALRITAQAGLGLQAAHERRIVHRDIKPANLFLAKGERGERTIKLLDFGVAKFRADPTVEVAETAGLTRTGTMLGSPLYMSPEQARGHRNIDYRADIWSLGVVLYQALCGRTPHQDNATVGDLIVAICTEQPRPLNEVAPWVSSDVAEVVHKALRIDPAERFQSAAEMLVAISALLPLGWVIRDEMLTPLSGVQPVPIAVRLPGPVSLRSDTPGATSLAAVGTSGGAPSAATPAPPKLGRAVALTLGGLAALILGGFSAYKVISPAEPQAGAPAELSSQPTAAPAPTASAIPTQSVRVAIKPRDAEVEIDGARVEPVDGLVAIEGTLGSIHKVRLRAGDAEATHEVVLTEHGALPPMVELEAPQKRPGTARTGARQTPPSPASKSTRPSEGIWTKR